MERVAHSTRTYHHGVLHQLYIFRQVNHIEEVGDVGTVLLEELHLCCQNQLTGNHHFGLVCIEVRVGAKEVGDLRLGRYGVDDQTCRLTGLYAEVFANIVRVLHKTHLLIEVQTRQRTVLAFAHQHYGVASYRQVRDSKDSTQVQLLDGGLAQQVSFSVIEQTDGVLHVAGNSHDDVSGLYAHSVLASHGFLVEVDPNAIVTRCSHRERVLREDVRSQLTQRSHVDLGVVLHRQPRRKRTGSQYLVPCSVQPRNEALVGYLCRVHKDASRDPAQHSRVGQIDGSIGIQHNGRHVHREPEAAVERHGVGVPLQQVGQFVTNLIRAQRQACCG